jgi:hypothetical protein
MSCGCGLHAHRPVVRRGNGCPAAQALTRVLTDMGGFDTFKGTNWHDLPGRQARMGKYPFRLRVSIKFAAGAAWPSVARIAAIKAAWSLTRFPLQDVQPFCLALWPLLPSKNPFMVIASSISLRSPLSPIIISLRVL